MGPPAAGKGTQAKELSKHYNIPSISTGAMIRHEIAAETEIGKKAKGFIDEGQLVPDELVIELLLKRLSEDDCKNGYILDGYPRNVDQAKIADKMGVDKNLAEREEFTKKKMQKVALQANTLNMLTAGFGTPLMAALICDKLEPVVNKANLHITNKKTKINAAKIANSDAIVKASKEESLIIAKNINHY